MYIYVRTYSYTYTHIYVYTGVVSLDTFGCGAQPLLKRIAAKIYTHTHIDTHIYIHTYRTMYTHIHIYIQDCYIVTHWVLVLSHYGSVSLPHIHTDTHTHTQTHRHAIIYSHIRTTICTHIHMYI